MPINLDLITKTESLIARFEALQEHGKTRPNAVMLESIDIREELLGMVPGLIAEIKRLREESKSADTIIAAKNSAIGKLQSSIQAQTIANKQTAKELDIQTSQEASYVKRLEAAYTDMVFYATGSDDEAQAALNKIRAGDKQ